MPYSNILVDLNESHSITCCIHYIYYILYIAYTDIYCLYIQRSLGFLSISRTTDEQINRFEISLKNICINMIIIIIIMKNVF